MTNDKKQYAIELDGALYHLSGNRLKQINDLNEVTGECRFVTDMQETVSRSMTVESQVKYAEFIVRKQLRESGDFEEPVSVMTHWKKKKGKNTTDIFFTALPTRLYHAYLEQISENEDSILMFPLYAVLYNVLRRIRSEDTISVVFQHNRFADLIIGNKKQIYYANRCVAFDNSEEQIAALWDTVRADINTAQKEKRVKLKRVFFLNWIDSGKLPDWIGNGEPESYCLEEEQTYLNQDVYHISFPKAVKYNPGKGGIASGIEKIYYYTQRWAAAINMLLLALFLAVSGGYLFCQQKVSMLENETKQLDRKIAVLQNIPSSAVPPMKEYRNTAGFIKNLAYYKNAPSYLSVMGDVSDALSSNMETQVIKMDYASSGLMLEIFGQIKAPFDTAYKGYQYFVSFMESKGYIVEKNRFDTDISNSQFLVKFIKRAR